MGLLDKVTQLEKYSLRVPGNGISTVGVNEIVRVLNRVGVNSLNRDKVSASEWQWDYRVGGKGEYVGVISKRIQKWCYQKHGIKLDEDTASQIGNLGNQHCDKATTYYFDWTKKFDWKKGDFGDEGSCFFPDNAGRPGQHWKAVYALEENGAWGMRFYQDETYKKGIGRLWVLDLDKYALCLNGYWTAAGCSSTNHGADHTLKLARVLAQWLDHLYYHRVKVTCSTPAMYLNGDASGNRCGYAVGHQPDVAGLYEVTLHWANPKTCKCLECKGMFADNEVHQVNDGHLCRACMALKYDLCVHCGGHYTKAHCKPIANGDLYCPTCLKAYTAPCKCCTKIFNQRQMYAVAANQKYCKECGPNLLGGCTHCGGKYLKEELVKAGGHTLCKPCYQGIGIACPHCQEPNLLPRFYICRRNGEKLEYYSGDDSWQEHTLDAFTYTTTTNCHADEFRMPAIEGEGGCRVCGKELLEDKTQQTIKWKPWGDLDMQQFVYRPMEEELAAALRQDEPERDVAF